MQFSNRLELFFITDADLDFSGINSVMLSVSMAVFAASDAVHVLYAIVLFKTAPLRVVRTSSRVVCDSCGRSVPAAQGVFFSDSGQSRFTKEQFFCAGCFRTASTELWETHECNRPGLLRKNCSVYKKRIAKKRTQTQRRESRNNSFSARSDGRNVGK